MLFFPIVAMCQHVSVCTRLHITPEHVKNTNCVCIFVQYRKEKSL